MGEVPEFGRFIGPYELVRKLGAGAFGEVWLVRHMELGVERAMKIPTDPNYVRQLRKEGQIQFNLKHPHIVETYDLHTLHSPPYCVMEYVEGGSLRDQLKRRGKLPTGEARTILLQVLDALHAAHAQGVLHRDIKPENILLTREGVAKISDFGLSKVHAEVSRTLLLTGGLETSNGEAISGTYAYMSPEQQKGEEATPQDDIYAVGVVACEVLTGERPSLGVAVAELFKEAGLSSSLGPVIQKALARGRRRYKSAAEMLDALSQLTFPRQALVQDVEAINALFGCHGFCGMSAEQSHPPEHIATLDRTPLTLSYEGDDGSAVAIFRRNTAIPAERTIPFSLSGNGQEQIRIKVFQGEKPTAAGNHRLCEVMVDGIQAVVHAVAVIQVTFSIDANGILNVSAAQEPSGRALRVTSSGSSGLSCNEVADILSGHH